MTDGFCRPGSPNNTTLTAQHVSTPACLNARKISVGAHALTGLSPTASRKGWRCETTEETFLFSFSGFPTKISSSLFLHRLIVDRIYYSSERDYSQPSKPVLRRRYGISDLHCFSKTSVWLECWSEFSSFSLYSRKPVEFSSLTTLLELYGLVSAVNAELAIVHYLVDFSRERDPQTRPALFIQGSQAGVGGRDIDSGRQPCPTVHGPGLVGTFRRRRVTFLFGPARRGSGAFG
ncbi:hypothetical protein BDP55DRAFT_76717 [Colletotrichum godetiae]|uniref:Uncharacterized protein n=1 Tax=Colletotrichum godetiae TaxID=1209918 RepID=A0AAJ0F017_9PEZI|nr:uncharacterized protein BDP55DRAFT_76717 [Colletotrichum godetiae]KAK1688078.1 hypothetical protein BDP55DRAFT_76717 [Colletotrichum godetiae]